MAQPAAGGQAVGRGCQKTSEPWAATSDARFRKLGGVVARRSRRVVGTRWVAKRGKPCPGWSFEKLQEKRQRLSVAGESRVTERRGERDPGSARQRLARSVTKSEINSITQCIFVDDIFVM